jgi:D-alanyl-D-alanine carboxypeptidase/D-alanyl-D-alanine-endopeptidase (penicillin-binding protein 4)
MQLVLRCVGTLTLALALRTVVAAAEPPLQSLAATVGSDQGVYAVAGDGAVLVAQAEARAVHPASVTKVATSLALLARLGASYRFTTTFRGEGALRDGRLAGDLVVEGGGDPFLVDESALLLLRRLQAQGVRAVERHVVVHGRLLFDWQPDPTGRHLEMVLAGRAGDAARATLARMEGAAAARPLTFGGGAASRISPAGASTDDRAPASPAADASSDGEPLRPHDRSTGVAPAHAALATVRSPILLHVVKALNCFSNNVFHFAADAVGGPRVVEELARARVSAAMRDEIVIENGAGAGATNRLSPRAAVALLQALGDELTRGGHELSAALPVSGIDPGTLEDRLLEQPALVIGKTGTFGSLGASALAGVLRTRRYGVVRFAVLNHGVAVPEARARQDAFVRALAAATGAEPWAYTTPATPPYLETVVD